MSPVPSKVGVALVASLLTTLVIVFRCQRSKQRSKHVLSKSARGKRARRTINFDKTEFTASFVQQESNHMSNAETHSDKKHKGSRLAPVKDVMRVNAKPDEFRAELSILATWDVADGLSKDDYVGIVRQKFSLTKDVRIRLNTCLGRDGHVLIGVDVPTDVSKQVRTLDPLSPNSSAYSFFRNLSNTLSSCTELQYMFARVAWLRLGAGPDGPKSTSRTDYHKSPGTNASRNMPQIIDTKADPTLGSGQSSLKFDKLAQNQRCAAELQQVASAVRMLTQIQLPMSLALWRAFQTQNTERGYHKVPTDRLRFHVFGRRGGVGHSFSSDELKRRCARAVSAVTPLTGVPAKGSGTVAELTFRAQVHNRSMWTGLRLNDLMLGKDSMTRKVRKNMQRETTKRLASSTDEISPSCKSSLGACVKECTAQLDNPTGSSIGRKKACKKITSPLWGENTKDITSIQDVVTPLAAMPYVEQVYHKNKEMNSVFLRLVRRTRKAWRNCNKKNENEHIHVPKWIEPVEGQLYLQVAPMLTAGPVHHYRNKCVFAVGLNQQGNVQCGFQFANSLRMKSGKKIDAGRIASAVDCVHISEKMAHMSAVFTSFLRQSPFPVVDAKAVRRRKRASRRHTGMNSALQRLEAARQNVGIWSGLIIRQTRQCPRDAKISDQTSSTNSDTCEIMVVAQVDAAGISQQEDSLQGKQAWLEECKRFVDTFRDEGATSIWLEHSINGVQVNVTDSTVPTARELHLAGTTHITQKLHMPPNIDDGEAMKFLVSPRSFFQINPAAAEAMFALIRRCALSSDGTPSDIPPHQSTVVLDVCCGCGSIGLTIAKAETCVGVVGVDSCIEAVADARKNAKLNGLAKKSHFIAGRAEDCIARLEDKLDELLVDVLNQDDLPPRDKSPHNAIDTSPISQNSWAAEKVKNGSLRIVAVVDPPRTGLSPGIIQALRNNSLVSRIIMVSCNPSGRHLRHDYVVPGGSFLENTTVLTGPVIHRNVSSVDQKKYESQTRQKKHSFGRCTQATRDSVLTGAPFKPVFGAPVDMFPMTPHCELIVVFERIMRL